MQKPKLTGWLIAFIVWVGVTSVNGLGALGKADEVWKPYMKDYPSLPSAVMVFQILTGAGILATLYCVWVLYQREPGSLKRAQMSLVIGSGLRIAGGWTIVLFGGLPKEMSQRLMPQLEFQTGVIVIFTGAWYYYFIRSERVRQIFTG